VPNETARRAARTGNETARRKAKVDGVDGETAMKGETLSIPGCSCDGCSFPPEGAEQTAHLLVYAHVFFFFLPKAIKTKVGFCCRLTGLPYFSIRILYCIPGSHPAPINGRLVFQDHGVGEVWQTR
jgi:hypothetical protein